MSKKAFYGRVSSEDQAERGTIKAQQEFAYKYADLHQLDIFESYWDDGISGMLPLEARPEGKRLIEDAKNKKFDTLLIYRVDRLGRSTRVILNAVAQLEELGVDVRSMTEPFDTSTPTGRFLLTVLAGVADLDRSVILERMQGGINRAAKEGKWLGGITPYGYVLIDAFLIPNELPIEGLEMSEVDVVRMAYDLVAVQHMSCIKIADYFNAIGIPTRFTTSGKSSAGKRNYYTADKWLPSRIHKMITNTLYKGVHTFGKRSTVKNRQMVTRDMPAIVDEKIWAKAQVVLHNNKLEAMRNSVRDYLLRGLIKCNECGQGFYGAAFNGSRGELTGWYICGGKIAYRGKLVGKCYAQNLNAAWIEDYVWNDCLTYIQNPEILDAVSDLEQSANDIDERPVEKVDIDFIKASLEKNEAERASIIALYRKQIITEDDLSNQLAEIDHDRELLENQLENKKSIAVAEAKISQSKSDAKKLLYELQNRLANEELCWELKREIIKLLISKITVSTEYGEDRDIPKTTIKIFYKIPVQDNNLYLPQSSMPHGQGFSADTRINIAGKEREACTRLIVTNPSSKGCRNTSRAIRENSGNSSRNNTPLWLNVTSPGFGTLPPPIRALCDIV